VAQDLGGLEHWLSLLPAFDVPDDQTAVEAAAHKPLVLEHFHVLYRADLSPHFHDATRRSCFFLHDFDLLGAADVAGGLFFKSVQHIGIHFGLLVLNQKVIHVERSELVGNVTAEVGEFVARHTLNFFDQLLDVGGAFTEVQLYDAELLLRNLGSHLRDVFGSLLPQQFFENVNPVGEVLIEGFVVLHFGLQCLHLLFLKIEFNLVLCL